VVFGRVVGGHDIVRIIENELTDKNDRPFAAVMVANCGELIPQKKKKKKGIDCCSSILASSIDTIFIVVKQNQKRKKFPRQNQKVSLAMKIPPVRPKKTISARREGRRDTRRRRSTRSLRFALDKN